MLKAPLDFNSSVAIGDNTVHQVIILLNVLIHPKRAT